MATCLRLNLRCHVRIANKLNLRIGDDLPAVAVNSYGPPCTITKIIVQRTVVPCRPKVDGGGFAVESPERIEQSDCALQRFGIGCLLRDEIKFTAQPLSRRLRIGGPRFGVTIYRKRDEG